MFQVVPEGIRMSLGPFAGMILPKEQLKRMHTLAGMRSATLRVQCVSACATHDRTDGHRGITNSASA